MSNTDPRTTASAGKTKPAAKAKISERMRVGRWLLVVKLNNEPHVARNCALSLEGAVAMGAEVSSLEYIAKRAVIWTKASG